MSPAEPASGKTSWTTSGPESSHAGRDHRPAEARGDHLRRRRGTARSSTRSSIPCVIEKTREIVGAVAAKGGDTGSSSRKPPSSIEAGFAAFYDKIVVASCAGKTSRSRRLMERDGIGRTKPSPRSGPRCPRKKSPAGRLRHRHLGHHRRNDRADRSASTPFSCWIASYER